MSTPGFRPREKRTRATQDIRYTKAMEVSRPVYGDPGVTVRRDFGKPEVSGKKRGRPRALIVSTHVGRGGISYDPAVTVAYMIRRALAPQRPLPVVTITDAAGKPVATYDPNTRKRTPIMQDEKEETR